VGGETNGSLANILDTATALLSKDADLQLLDRAEVDRVLREHALSLAGLERAEHAVKAGQLLQADLFAVLEGSLTNEAGESTSLGLVVFDAKTGARYADSALVASNMTSAASATEDAVRAAVAKFYRNPADLHTVGLLLVRNADLPRQFDGLCDTVGLLLERELTASPGIAVLERRRLEQVTQERAVAPDAEGNRLLSSLRMIELDISRDGDGLRGSLALAGTDGARSAPITASVPTRDAAALAHLLADKTERFLKAPTDGPLPNRAAEAARFHRECLLSQTQHDYKTAVRTLDAALALDPEQEKWQEEMARLLPSASIEASGDLATCLALAQRDADLMLDLARKAAQDFKPGDPIPGALSDANRSSLDSLRQKLASIIKSNTIATAEIAALAGEERTLRMEIMEPFLSKQSVNRTSFATYSKAIFNWIYPPGSSDERRQDDLLAMRHWVGTSHRVNPPDGSGDYTPFQRFGNAGFFWVYRGNEAEEFRQSLELDQDQVIQIYARAGRVVALMATGGQDAAASDKVWATEREFRLYAQDLLTRGDGETSAALRFHLWRAIEMSLALRFPPNPEAWREFVEACRFALAHGRIEPNLFYDAASALKDPEHRNLPEELELLNTGIKLFLNNPEAYPTNYGGRSSFIKDLLDKRDRLAGELAGVNTNAPAPSPWKQKDCLLDLAEPIDGLDWLFKPMVQDGQVFALALGIQEWGLPEDTLQLVRVPLNGGPPSFLGRATITGFEWRDRNSARRPDPALRLNEYAAHADAGRAACFGDGGYFAATCSGIYIFPTNGGPVLHLGTTNGLPSEDTHAVACLDGKLYFDAGDFGHNGSLASYELATHKITILASSRRSEHLSPFDDQPPFYADCIVADAARHRLVMAISSRTMPDSTGSAISSSMGIWAYLPSTGEYKRLAPLRLVANSIPVYTSSLWPVPDWAGLVDSNTLLVRHSNGLATFDLSNDRIVLATQPFLEEGNSPIALWRRPSSANSVMTYLVNGPFFIRNGWFYSARPFDRMRLADGTTEQFPPLRTDYPMDLQESFQLLDDGKHVLAADQYSIWLLELNPEPVRAGIDATQIPPESPEAESKR
jgi:hypothetical protein